MSRDSVLDYLSAVQAGAPVSFCETLGPRLRPWAVVNWLLSFLCDAFSDQRQMKGDLIMARIWEYVRGWRVGVVFSIVWMVAAVTFLVWFAAGCSSSTSSLVEDRETELEVAR